MELEIYNAFVKAGVSESDAKAAVESINKEIDKRYALHAQQLATRGDVETVRKDMAEMKTELIKAIAESQRWTITAIFAAVGVFAALSKMIH
jgi:multidrug resistance efflux pump